MPRHREPIAALAVGPVQRRDRLGGVLHEYVRQAADAPIGLLELDRVAPAVHTA
jgi:hypothetical protein